MDETEIRIERKNQLMAWLVFKDVDLWMIELIVALAPVSINWLCNPFPIQDAYHRL